MPVIIVATSLPPRETARIGAMSDLLARITHDPEVMGGRPCIRGMRVTVGMILGLLASGRSVEDVLAAYPYLERDDVRAALSYASWRAEEVDLPLKAS
jgi:uncharacterized protein (DUF433 family)